MNTSLLLHRVLGVGAIASLALALSAVGCGGGNSNSEEDSGPEVDSSPLEGGSSSGLTSSSSSGASSSSSGGSSSGSLSSSGSSGSSGASSSGASGSGAVDGGHDSAATSDSGNDSGTKGDSTTEDTGTTDSSTTTDSTTTDSSTNDSSSTPDTSTGDGSSTDSGIDSATKVDAAEAGATCGAENAACTDMATDGLCKAGVCAHCDDPADDGHCATAYGSAAAPYLCLGGICTPGDCRHNADCAGNPNGTLCGVITPHVCGKCTADTQCADQAGGPVCNTATGACVAGACTAVGAGGGAPNACGVNAADICCTGTCQAGAGATACCPGTDSATYCTAKVGSAASCVNNTCTKCLAVTGNTYVVDPVNGSDVTGTGDGTTPGCAFKTIARALQVIPHAPVVATTIAVLGPSTVAVASGETFPIALPQNVTVAATGGAVEVDVPSGAEGFTLTNVGSAINGGTLGDAGAAAALTIKPAAGASNATIGVVVDTGTGVTANNAPEIANTVVTGFPNDGILVQNAGVVQIGAGVTSTLNALAGLHVMDDGEGIVDVAAGALPTHFDGNTVHGIHVNGNGAVTITGSITSVAMGVGTVTTNNNVLAGVWIEQTPGGPAPPSSITGLVSAGNTNGNGIRLVGGSNVRLRASALVGNSDNGLIVSAGAGMAGNDISMIDVGTAPDAGGAFGGNTFQEPLLGPHNGGAGICLDVNANAGTLRAAGNIFGMINCATTGGAVTVNAGDCTNACAGGICDLGIMNTTGNAIDVTICTQ